MDRRPGGNAIAAHATRKFPRIVAAALLPDWRAACWHGRVDGVSNGGTTMRFLIALTFGAALAISAPIASDAFAKGKKPANKMCKATGWDGKVSKFKCKATEKCCFDYLINKGSCLPKDAICL